MESNTIERPKAGFEFTHESACDPDWKPSAGQKYADAPLAKCVVTTVRNGWVYYGYTGHVARTGGCFKERIAYFTEHYGTK